MNAVKKLAHYLDLPTTALRHTPYVYNELHNAGYQLYRGHTYETFVKDVVTVLRECGFAVREKGIGWEVTP